MRCCWGMPGRSGSSASFWKANWSSQSSKRSCSKAQSTMSKSLNRGSPSPMSQTSSTEKMSPIKAFSSSSPLFAFLEVLNASCFFCQSANNFLNSDHLSSNHLEGCNNSSLLVRFFSNTFSRKYAFAAPSFAHSKRTASKPSAFSGIEKFEKQRLKVTSVRSAVALGANQAFCSSSVSSTAGGSSPMSSSSSSAASFFSSSPSLAPSSTSICFGSSSPILASSFCSSFFSPSALPSAGVSSPSAFFFASASSRFFFASSRICFRFSAASFLIAAIFCSLSLAAFAWAFLTFFSFHSCSTFCCFASNIFSCCLALNSVVGSPITTQAVFLKHGLLKRFSNFSRSPEIKLPWTSMTT
mmetsp:Transcript_94193/g.272184  ORF Transcript_94193/g.272184 Transcript_94193/m.272184 type:complete len:355 (-) Transcript_94193:1026-2090(-)